MKCPYCNKEVDGVNLDIIKRKNTPKLARASKSLPEVYAIYCPESYKVLDFFPLRMKTK